MKWTSIGTQQIKLSSDLTWKLSQLTWISGFLDSKKKVSKLPQFSFHLKPREHFKLVSAMRQYLTLDGMNAPSSEQNWQSLESWLPSLFATWAQIVNVNFRSQRFSGSTSTICGIDTSFTHPRHAWKPLDWVIIFRYGLVFLDDSIE